MDRFRDLPISTKLRRTVAGVIATFALSIVVAEVFGEGYLSRERAREDLAAMARVLAASSAPSVVFDDRKTAEHDLAALREAPNILAATLLTAKGAVFAAYRRVDSAAIAPVVSLEQPLMLGGEPVGRLLLDSDLPGLRRSVATRTLGIVIIAAISGLVAFFLFRRLERLITGPLLGLTAAMGNISRDKNYSLRVPKKSGDEIGSLVDGFNDMLRQIGERDSQLELKVAARTADLNEREKRLTESLKEKEVLLREVHHRVKNNMQVVSGLLQLQARRVRDEETRLALLESEHRIRSMALIHEKLYHSHELARIDPKAYFTDFSRELVSAYGGDRITVNLEVEQMPLTVDQAIPCGLILNELVTNALKHGLPAGRTGTIDIGLHATGDAEVELSVADDGDGLADDFDWERAESLGLRLVRNLARQLGGTIELDRLPRGTRFRLRFMRSVP